MVLQAAVKRHPTLNVDALGLPVCPAGSHGETVQPGRVVGVRALQPPARVGLPPSRFPAAPVPPLSDPRSDYTSVRPEPGEPHLHCHLPAIVQPQAPCFVSNVLAL